jgi:hypothetical protein
MYTDNNDNKIQALDAALNSWIQEKSKSDFALDVLCMFHAMRCMVSSDRSWSLGRRSWRDSCGMEDPHLEAKQLWMDGFSWEHLPDTMGF